MASEKQIKKVGGSLSQAVPERGERQAVAPVLTTLSRGLAILEFVLHSPRFVRLRDVAEHFEMDRSAALRFLRTLEASGYIVRHEAMKVYSLGPKLFSLPRTAAGVEPLIALARPVLEDLARSTGQIAHMATLSGLDAVLVEVVASNAPVSVKQAVGDLEPLYTSAVGKALYAFMPDAERELLCGRIAFEAFTARTIVDRVAFEREASIVRTAGIAFDRQEGNDHIVCIGCPIMNAAGRAVAAIGISYVSAHLAHPIDEAFADIERLRLAARKLEATLPTSP